MSTDSWYHFLGDCVYISYLENTSFPHRNIKRCFLRQNLQYTLLKFALSTHLFQIQLLILSPVCRVKKMLYLARGSIFRDLISVSSTGLYPFPLLSTVVMKKVRHAWAYIKLFPSSWASSTRRHCWKSLYTVNVRDIYVRSKMFVYA